MKIERWFEGNCLAWAFGVWSPGGCRYLLAREQIWVWFATLVRWLEWQNFLCACLLRGDFSIYYQLLLAFHSCCAPGWKKKKKLDLSSHLQPPFSLSTWASFIYHSDRDRKPNRKKCDQMRSGTINLKTIKCFFFFSLLF